MKKPLTLGLVVTAGSMASGLYAQENKDTMVVVGSRTPTQINQIPSAVQVVEEAELQQQIETGADLKTALGKLVPGLDFAPQGRTNYGQNMRGRSVQVLVDGISMNSSRGLSRQFDSIDPFNIERIEVLSGASSLYGGGATGGIINIITKRGESGGPHWESEAGVTTGFNNSDDRDYRVAQSASGGNEHIQGRIGVAYQDNGRQYDGNGDEIFPDISQTDLQDNRSIDIFGSLTVNLDTNQTLELGAQLYRSGYEGDRSVYFPNLDADPANLNDAEIRDGFNADREPETDRKMVNLQYHNADFLKQNFYLQAYHREEEASFHPFPYVSDYDDLDGDDEWDLDEPVNQYAFSASKQNTDLTGIKALFDAQPGQDVNLTYGVDLDRESFDASQMYFDTALTDASGGLIQRNAGISPRYPGYEIDTYAGYMQGDWQATDALKVSGGIRHQYMDVEIDDFQGIPGGENDYDATLFNAQALYDFQNGQQSWVQFSQGFELPDPAKYYGQDEGFNVAENPLSAIETNQFEIGWRYQGAHWQAQTAAYYAWSDESLEYNSDGLSVNVVDEKKRDFGLESKVTRYFDNGFEAGGTLHLVRSEQKNDSGDWEKRGIDTSSPSSATAFVGWSDLDRSARLQANHEFDLEDDEGGRIDSHTTLDLSLSQQTDVGKVSLGIQNLLDESYSTTWGQRAASLYSPRYGPEYLYDYQGRGRTYTLNWSMSY
ncbi:TonB-dependent receptor [Aidingimonas halophila]|uniref:Ferric aerobactin receptor n=1 Tax=Aidingimonas halophila TaxID=574349 RepID=A0A1H2U4E1_9GAMM|nr:TonB-dependent receptor [Aidingimonas halophila]GHC22189.1 TonB-dependent receptor [Aidingimonas halophila]SDW51065.1 iron complex outermembrane recepter protein [Aidingimonas halophila]